MKLRAIFLAFALMLLIAPLASADQAFGPAELRAAIFADPAASPDCADDELSFEPARQEKSVLCGSCSQPLCVGKQWGQFCKYQGGRYYYCQPAYVVCDPDDCQCWTGPLP